MSEIFKFGKNIAFKCADCGKTEGDFNNEKEAQIALRLHKIGCKKS
jgi:hypothetical protein